VRINNFSDVTLRLLMVLCSVSGEELPTTRDLAETVGTPYNHVSKAVLKLRQMGLVEAIRGRSGGVRITPEGRKATVGGVLRVLDDHSDVAACQTVAGECPLIHDCGLRGALNHAREAFYASLDDVAVGSLVRGAQPGPVAVILSTRPES
jgi:Rrf2 family nitric oxide-sensitive transcriptional repressor